MAIWSIFYDLFYYDQAARKHLEESGEVATPKREYIKRSVSSNSDKVRALRSGPSSFVNIALFYHPTSKEKFNNLNLKNDVKEQLKRLKITNKFMIRNIIVYLVS
jgi:hypothetical protein